MYYCPRCKHGHTGLMDFQDAVRFGSFSGDVTAHCGMCGWDWEISPRIIVTRHKGLVKYLYEIGMFCHSIDIVIQHATPEEIHGRDVIGVLPLHLAVHARSVTEIPLSLTQEDRGQDLSVNRVREIAGAPTTYHIFQSEQLDSYNFGITSSGSVVEDGTGMAVFNK